MSFRPLLLVAPAALAAGLLLAVPASALDSGLDDPLELAQATPPTPAAPGTDRRDRASFNPKTHAFQNLVTRGAHAHIIESQLHAITDSRDRWTCAIVDSRRPTSAVRLTRRVISAAGRIWSLAIAMTALP